VLIRVAAPWPGSRKCIDFILSPEQMAQEIMLNFRHVIKNGITDNGIAFADYTW